jgi:hemerythrin
MSLITWSHACTVGVKAMDDQHGNLMDTLNELRLMLLRSSAHEEVNEQLERLVQFTSLHFESEEQLLEQNGYPGLPEHRIAHRRLLSEIRRTVDRAEQSSHVAIGPLLVFLRDWYLNHIEGLDQQYGAWLNERGIF